MPRMRRRCLLLGCVGVVWLGACGASEEAVAPGCTDRADVERAIADRGRLPDGTRLSQCLARATDPAALQNLGAVLTTVAEELEDRAATDPVAARRLGFLIGAARRGVADGDGRAAELAHRLERSGAAVSDEAAAAAALAAGLRDGEASG
jgi:hypothetical protein